MCNVTTDRALLIHIEERVPAIMIYYQSTITIYAYSIKMNFFIGTHSSFILIIIIRDFSNYLINYVFIWCIIFFIFIFLYYNIITLNIKYVFYLHVINITNQISTIPWMLSISWKHRNVSYKYFILVIML